MTQKWSNPVPLEEYIQRMRDTGLPEAVDMEAWLREQANGFACGKHPFETPYLQYTHASDEIQIVCAPCRSLS